MVKTLELPAVCRIAVERLGKAVNATSAYLLTCNLESGGATILAEYFSSRANQWESKPDLGASYNLNEFPQTLAALRSGKSLQILISDPLVDQTDRNELSAYHVKSSLNLPMVVSDTVLGYVEIWDSLKERVWSEDEVRLCQTLANQAAIVIENARLYNETQHMAVTDALTGAYNRRGLFEVGQREINRSRRVSRPLSAIMLDIDFFKQINDLHSHAVGDQILQGLAKLCMENLRDIDIFGRYGGDEFAILLPETDVNSANYVAQRLRRRVAEMPFDSQNGPISISISLGVACTIGEITDLAVLLDCADSAMYEAKRAGRNQVCVV
jgi:diguanylate cyclase (GGDEF)-like protein